MCETKTGFSTLRLVNQMRCSRRIDCMRVVERMPALKGRMTTFGKQVMVKWCTLTVRV